VAVLTTASRAGRSADSVYAEELSRYDVYRDRLTALTARQEALLSDIRSKMVDFDSSSRRETSAAVSQRQAVLQS